MIAFGQVMMRAVGGNKMTNEIAQRGFAAATSVYERGRPDYPDAVVEAFTDHLALERGSLLLDLASGSGKLARRFLGRAEVIAVEQAGEMCAEFARLQPGVPVVRGIAEALPLTGASLDAAVIGTAFHWFDGPASLRELHRVLRPGGGLGLVWLQRDETVPWVDALVRLVDTYRPADARRYAETPWQAVFESDEGRALFTPLESASFPFAHNVDRATAVERTASTSFVAAMPPEGRAEVLARVAALLAERPETRGLETIGIPHIADVYWSRRR
jgi:ubiquinone/menaquinone biosynthesis C-methylase UbiE